MGKSASVKFSCSEKARAAKDIDERIYYPPFGPHFISALLALRLDKIKRAP